MQSIIECTASLCTKPFHWRVFFCYKHLITDYSTNRRKKCIGMAALHWLYRVRWQQKWQNKKIPNIVRLFYLGSVTADCNKRRNKRTNERKKKIEENNSFSFRFRVLIRLALKIVVSIAHELCFTKTFCQRERPVTIFQMWTIFGFGLPIFFSSSLRFAAIFILFHRIPVWI